MMRIVREFLGNHSLPPLGSVCDCCHIGTLEKVATQEGAVWFSVVNLGAGIRFYLFFDNLEEDGFLRSLSFFTSIMFSGQILVLKLTVPI